jgi:isoleucyl-tRNA synthetase
MAKTGKVSIGDFVDLDAEIVERNERPKANFIVSIDNGLTLALDTTIDETLLAEGLIRELIRQIQVLRKDSDFLVEQRIVAEITTDSEFALAAINENKEKIALDILATSIERVDKPDAEKEFDVQGHTIKVKMAKV